MGGLGSISNKMLVVGLVIGLVVGLGIGYIITPKGLDTADLEQQISDLEGQITERTRLPIYNLK